MKLTKSMFGDIKCKSFGLSNNQMRHNSIINNAGWYNLQGEKLGAGDLSLPDMVNIAKTISPTEAFVVLSEMDSMWDMPSTFDHTAPGKDYVLHKAIWIIGQDVNGGNAIVRIRENISKLENAEQDGIKYYRIPREEFFKTVGYTPKKLDLSSKPIVKKEKTIEEKMKDAVNKLSSLKPTKSSSSSSSKSITKSTGSINHIGGGSISGAVPAKTNPAIAGGTIVKKSKPIKKVSSSP